MTEFCILPKSCLNVDEVTHTRLLIGTSFAPLTRHHTCCSSIPKLGVSAKHKLYWMDLWKHSWVNWEKIMLRLSAE